MCRPSLFVLVAVVFGFPEVALCQVIEAKPIDSNPTFFAELARNEKTPTPELGGGSNQTSTVVYFDPPDGLVKRRIPFEERSLEMCGVGYRHTVQTVVSGSKFFAKSIVEPFLSVADLWRGTKQAIQTKPHATR